MRGLRAKPPAPEWVQRRCPEAAGGPVWSPSTHRGVKRARVCGPASAHSVLRALGTRQLGLPPGCPSVPAHVPTPSTTFCIVLHTHCTGDKPEVLRSQARLLGQETGSNICPPRPRMSSEDVPHGEALGHNGPAGMDAAGCGPAIPPRPQGVRQGGAGRCWPDQ